MRRDSCAALALAAVIAAALPHASASAQHQDRASADLTSADVIAHLAEIGTWKLASTRLAANGSPECREVWRFAADGTGTVESGDQRVSISWRAEPVPGEAGEYLMFQTGLSSNEGPDCLGIEIDPGSFPREEWGFTIRFTEDGSARLCGRVPAAILFNECWAVLRPARGG